MAEGGGKSDIEAGRAFVTLLLKDKGWSKGLAAAGKQLQHVGRGMAVVGAAITAVGASIVAPLVEMAREFANSSEELSNMSARTNMSVQQLQFLGFAAEKTGTSLELIQKASFAAAKEGKSFDQLASQVAGVQDPAKQTEKAIELFGKKLGPFLVPMIRQMAKLREEFDALGIGISDKDVAAGKELAESFIDLRAIIKQVRDVIGAALAPTIKIAVDWIKAIVVSIAKWVNSHRELFVSALKIGAVIMGVGTAIVGLGLTISLIGTALVAFNGVLGLAMAALGFLVSPVGLVIAALVGLTAWFATSTTAGQQMVGAIKGYFGELFDTAKETWAGISDAIAAGDLALAAKIAWVGLKVVWFEGTRYLHDKWISLKDAIETTILGVVFTIEEYWQSVVSKVKAIWQGWVSFAKGIGESIGFYLTRSSDPATAAEQDRAHNQALEQIRKEGQEAQARIANEKTAKLDAIEEARKAAQQAQRENAEAEHSGLAKQLADAKDELDALRKKAADERKAKEDEKDKAKADQLTSDSINDKFVVTFNAALKSRGTSADPVVRHLKEQKRLAEQHLAEAKKQTEYERAMSENIKAGWKLQ